MSREIELKLATSVEDLPALRRMLCALAPSHAAGPRAAKLNATYYDTPDFALRRRDLTLRVRRQPRSGIVQTVKSGAVSGGGPFARGEWEDQLASERPDLQAAETGKRLRWLDSADLRPIFTTAVSRSTILLEPRPGTKIEAAIDEGEIRLAGDEDRAEPIAEIELELKAGGDGAALCDVALRLLEIAPALRVEIRSKSERGYRLAADRSDPASVPHDVHVSPGDLHLEPSMTVEAVLQAVGRQCLTHLLRNEPAALAGDADAVHQMRVAARRLRSVLSTMKPMLAAAHYDWVTGELKLLADGLGAARNWDVVASSLLAPVEDALVAAEPGLEELARGVEARRAAAYEAARAMILSRRYTEAVLRLLRWFEGRAWRDQAVSEQSARLLAPIGEIAPELLDRCRRKARKLAGRFDALPPEGRHKLRIALKKLRYAAEFLGPLYAGRRLGAYLKRLKPLQDHLGHANDVHVAHRLLAELGASGAAADRAGGLLLGWHDRGLADREREVSDHVRRMRRATPFWRD